MSAMMMDMFLNMESYNLSIDVKRLASCVLPKCFDIKWGDSLELLPFPLFPPLHTQDSTGKLKQLESKFLSQAFNFGRSWDHSMCSFICFYSYPAWPSALFVQKVALPLFCLGESNPPQIALSPGFSVKNCYKPQCSSRVDEIDVTYVPHL